jgi:hypothetical protein
MLEPNREFWKIFKKKICQNMATRENQKTTFFLAILRKNKLAEFSQKRETLARPKSWCPQIVSEN